MSRIIERNIIVEGVECAGKTTLIDELRRKAPGWDLKYLGHRTGNQYERYMWEYMVNKGVIFNRSHFSEVVYSRLRQREEPFTEPERRVLDDVVARNTLVIFCDPRIEDVRARFMQRSTVQPVQLEELEVVHGMFRDIFEGIPCMRYESRDMTARDAFVKELAGHLST